MKEPENDARSLARVVAHRLNNHLTALFGQLDLLSLESSDPATAARLDDLRDATERISVISKELQEYGQDEEATAPALQGQGPLVRTILVIEDDPGVLAVAHNVLSALGHRVLPAASGEEAERIAASLDAPVDLILTDVGLPGVLGPEVVDRIRAERPATRVVFATGDAARARRQVPALASIPLLHKPYRRTDLARAVAEALDAP